MGIFFAVYVLFFLMFVGMIVLIVYFVVRASKAPTGTTATPQGKNERLVLMEKIAGRRSELSPWQGRSAGDLVKNITYSYVNALSSKFRGTLYSTDKEAIVAFERVEGGFKMACMIAAASTDFELFYIYDGTKTGIYYDRKPLGEIYPGGILKDSNGRQIGVANRKDNVTFEFGSIYEHVAGDQSYAIEINGRKLATMLMNRRVSDFNTTLLSNQLDSGDVIVVHEQPTDNEEQWLKALTIFEIVYHGYSAIDRRMR